MALPDSSIYQVCKAVAKLLQDNLKLFDASIAVTIGNLSDVAQRKDESTHRLNLFFYRFEPSGFFPYIGQGDTWLLRMSCLVTAFGHKEKDISEGENELRLLGEAIRIFHEFPVLHVDVIQVRRIDKNAGYEEENLEKIPHIFTIQSVFQPLSPDELNHIWSTQGDATFRASVAYEISLTPVFPDDKVVEAARVAEFGTEIRSDMSARTADFSGEKWFPAVGKSTVNTDVEDWAPVICFVHDGACAQSIILEENGQELTDFEPNIWIAGSPGSEVTLVWEKWTKSEGWERLTETETSATADSEILDPEAAASAITKSIDFPTITLGAEETSAQAMIYAERKYNRAYDGTELTVKSNPLLVTIYKNVQ